MLTLNPIIGKVGRQDIWLRAVRKPPCIGNFSLRPREEGWAPDHTDVLSAKERSAVG